MKGVLAVLLAGLAWAAVLATPRAGATAYTVAPSPAGWSPAGFWLREPTRARVLVEADHALQRRPAPVAQLASAGSVELDAPEVAASRAAFADADDAVILAMAARATGQARYRAALHDRLLAWAETYHPSGHPIDEARLAPIVDAWMLSPNVLSAAETDVFRDWLEALRDAKRAWVFGPRTADNNHRTWQLASLLQLDHGLGDAEASAADRAAAADHATRNLDAATGESVDLLERDALRYHAFDLEGWLEIALIAGCCEPPIRAAVELLEGRIAAGELGGEFTTSQVPLDGARARAGHGYGAPGSAFDVRRAERVRLAWATLSGTRADAPEAAEVLRRNLYVYARYQSWTR